MSDGHQIDVVIATCRRERLLRRTLESLSSARLPASLTQVRIVENGSRGGAEEVCDAFSSLLPVSYAFQQEGNKSRALNRALADSRADLICFLDDDVRVERSWLAAYADAAERYGPSHHFAGPVLPDWQEKPPDWLIRYLPPSARGWYHGDEERYYDRPHFIGSNWAAFRRDILSVGGFAEHIGPGSEAGAIGDEMELQQRMLDAGGRGVYLPDARIWHHVPSADCDFDWARRRQHRTGLTYGVLGWIPPEGPIPTGLGGGWRLSVLAAKVAVARFLGWSDQRRAHLEMRFARTRGYLKGRRLAPP